jgi:isochorismate synthase
LADLLKFKFPGKEVQIKMGHFERVPNKKDLFGFVVVDFKAENWYIFRENEHEEFKNFHSENASDLFVVNQDQYRIQIKKMISKMQSGDLKKCVLSRIKKVDIGQLNVADFFNKLCVSYPNAFVYFISSQLFGTWIGASPEVFLKADQHEGFAMSLAATKKNEDDSPWNSKEKEEQSIVTEYLKLELEKVSDNIKVNDAVPFNAGPVKHLMSKLSFDFKRKHMVDFIQQIHPTPAVCGFPKKEALDQILEIELHDRALYSGIIGWCGEREIELFVNLRCSRIIGNQMYMFLGGGITAQSDPELEWQETEHKSRTLLDHIKFNTMNS